MLAMGEGEARAGVLTEDRWEEIKKQIAGASKGMSSHAADVCERAACPHGVDDAELRRWLHDYFGGKIPGRPPLSLFSLSLAIGQSRSFLGIYLYTPDKKMTPAQLDALARATGHDLSCFLNEKEKGLQFER